MSRQEMRAVYAETLLELAESDPRIVVLDADLSRSNGTDRFKEAYPNRFINVGVAEANMIGISAGLSTTGLIPFPATFTCFAARRTFDQFFISANYAKQNVKLTGTDPGIAAVYNGGTHMSFEDVGLMRTIPAIVIYEPCDATSLRQLLQQAAQRYGTTYLRLFRKAVDPVHADDATVELGKGIVLLEGTEVTVIASGALMVPEALSAAAELRRAGISTRVIDMHTIKPIDTDLVIAAARETGAIVTCENHQVRNGLGSAVAEVLVEHAPVPMRRIGVQDQFGEVGDLAYLKQRYKLTADHIVAATREVLAVRDGGKQN